MKSCLRFAVMCMILASPARGERSFSLETLKHRCVEFSEIKIGSGPEDAADCQVSDFQRLGELEGSTYYYALYCLIPSREKGQVKCGDNSYEANMNSRRGEAIFTQAGRSGPLQLLFKRAAEDLEMFGYEKPQLIPSPQGPLLLLPIVVVGTGAGNESELYIREKGRWERIDTESWLKDLTARLPKGREIWKGIWPDYQTMTAEAGLYKPADANCCPTGGNATIQLSLNHHKIELKSVSFQTLP